MGWFGRPPSRLVASGRAAFLRFQLSPKHVLRLELQNQSPRNGVNATFWPLCGEELFKEVDVAGGSWKPRLNDREPAHDHVTAAALVQLATQGEEVLLLRRTRNQFSRFRVVWLARVERTKATWK
jgi:hypothetical protein